MNGAQWVALRSDVIAAAAVLPVSWPIETFIAVNPLSGLEDMQFGAALRCAGEWYGAAGTLSYEQFRALYAQGRIAAEDLAAAIALRCPDIGTHVGVAVAGRHHTALSLVQVDLRYGPVDTAPPRAKRLISERRDPRIAHTVDTQTSKWCAAFFGAPHTAWSLPDHSGGLYRAWRDLAWRDGSVSRSVRNTLRTLPSAPEDAVLSALDALGVGSDARADYLRAHLTAMPGWASHIRWRHDQNGDVDLLDYLAIRLSYEAALLAGTVREVGPEPSVVRDVPSVTDRASAVAAHLGAAADASAIAAIADVLAMLPVGDRRLVWQDAYEHHYRTELLTRLAGEPAPAPAAPEAQLICCIDTRSEELRRHLEDVGPYETLGFAGFFAVAIRHQQLGSAALDAQCPVLVTPQTTVTEQVDSAPAHLVRRAEAGRRELAGAEDAFSAAKHGTLTPFALAEAGGWAAGPIAALKTLSPRGHVRLRRAAERVVRPQPPTTVNVEDFTAEEKELFAEAALTMMGLTDRFAPLVVLCGHGSTTENNPYASALHCGACGGHRGAVNARTAAAILNEPEVQRHLSTRGIDIPYQTWFVAAEHDTSRDTVTLLDTHLVPATHADRLQRLSAALAEAGDRSSLRRAATLPGAQRRSPRRTLRRVRARSDDWAQVYPEWGLAGNACFIVGPRAMTAGIDLQRRAFLHSYVAEADPSGAGLETILTAPLIVAQWINHQYYFSSVDPEVFGAGSKTIHNVVGDVGVLAGHNGDLKIGLPWQSVGVGSELVHEPVRLLAVVQAPLERIETIIERNPLLQNLFDNEWIALVARDDYGRPWQKHTPTGWQPSPYRKPESA